MIVRAYRVVVLGALGLLGVLMRPLPAAGATEVVPRIALSTEAPGATMTARLAAEIRAIGFQVVIVPPDVAGVGSEALEATAGAMDAIAAIRVSPVRGGDDIWVVDRLTGKTVIRRVPHRRRGRDETLVALRAVELLRGSLLEVRAPAPAGMKAVAAPAAVEALVGKALGAPADPRFALALAPSVVVSPGGLTPALGSLVTASWLAGPRWAWDVSLLVPHVGARTAGPEGDARVDVLMGGAGARFLVGAPTGALRAAVGAGVLAAWLRMDGDVDREPFVAREDYVLVPAPYLRLDATLGLSWRWRMGVHLVGGATIPQAGVDFGGRLAARWGRPFVMAGLGAEVLLF